MAKGKQEDSSEGLEQQAAPRADVVSVGKTELAEAIVQASELASGQRRRIPHGQQQIRSPFNPSGKRGRKIRPWTAVWQAGFRVSVKTLTDREIELLAKMKPGRYIDGLVTVVVKPNPDGSELFINYNNKTADQRMALGSRVGAKGFEGMLEMMLAEKTQQDKDIKAVRRREIEEAMAEDSDE